jgi:hypothetical protein
MDSKEICVIHLVRASNGIGPLKRFLTSYRSHTAGLEHDLFFILKGFGENEISFEIETLLNQYEHHRMDVPDEGYDIGSYIAAAQLLENKFLCFLNSFSEILDDNWLEKLYRYVSTKECGMVSATGSWESQYTNSQIVTHRFFSHYLTERLFAFKIKRNFLPFPNPHLRTNGFCISRELFLDFTRGYTFKNKNDTLIFESGREGISRKIASRGLQLIVVGRNGRGFLPNEWSTSGTFRQGGQENLLVADNQTRQFTNADNSKRIVLSRLAWGKKSNNH